MVEEKVKASPLMLMRIACGFGKTAVLASAIELELFTLLSARGEGIDVQGVSELLKIEIRPARALLSYCTALGLLKKKDDGLYHNSPEAEEFLVKGKPYYFGDFVVMAKHRLYPAWAGLTESIKTNLPRTLADGGQFGSIYSHPEKIRVFLKAMHSLSVLSGKAAANALNIPEHSRILDVGGGSAAYSIGLLEGRPDLRATVFDLQPALEIAEEEIAKAGLAGRIGTHAGDFFKQELPKGFNVALLSMILHDWTPEEGHHILQRCFSALTSGGLAVISELMMDDDLTGPLDAAWMGTNMLVMGTGFNYTWAEYEQWLERVGFKGIQRIPLGSPGANGVLIGFKP